MGIFSEMSIDAEYEQITLDPADMAEAETDDKEA